MTVSERLRAFLRGSALRLHIVGAVLLTALVLLFQGEGLWQSHQHDQEQSQASARNFGAILAGSIAGALRTIDLTLMEAIDLDLESAAGNGGRNPLGGQLQALIERAPEIVSLRLTDAAGNVTFGTSPGAGPISVADRDYFLRLKDDAQAGMVISEPVNSGMNRDWQLICARRITLPDGRFGGILFGTIAIDGVVERLSGRRINLGTNDMVAIVDSHMTIIARYLHNRQDMDMTGRKIAAASLEDLFGQDAVPNSSLFQPAADPVARRYFSQRVPGRPLAVIIGVSPDSAFGGWWRAFFMATLNVTIFVALVVYGSTLIYRAQRRQDKALKALDNALLFNRTVIDSSEIGIHVYRQDGQCVLANAALIALVGSNEQSVLRQNFRALQSWRSSGAIDIAERALKDGIPCRHQSSVITKYGKAMWVQWVFTPFSYNGAPHLMVMSRDISDVHMAQVSLELSNRRLLRLSDTDGLTGINNRRCFDETMDNEWRRAARNRQSMALMLIDVDHFKKYNDYYGHQKGDDCLRSIASVLNSHCARAGDLAARYGGEEFAFIAPATSGENAAILAEAIRADIENLAIAHAGSPVGRVSISIGIAAVIPGPGHTAAKLIERADKALYQAKDDGRNKVVLAAATSKEAEQPAELSHI